MMIEMAPGICRQTLAGGDAMMQMLVTFAEAGNRLPEHAHPHEQITHVVTGRMRFRLDGGTETRDLSAGESLYLAGHRLHAAEALEPAVVLDTFSPPREDLLAQDRQN